MTPKSKLFLALAGGTGVLLALGSKKKANAAEPPEDELDVEPPVGPPVSPGLPQPQPPVLIPPLPGETIPAPIPIPEEADGADSGSENEGPPKQPRLPPDQTFPPIQPIPLPEPPSEVVIPPTPVSPPVVIPVPPVQGVPVPAPSPIPKPVPPPAAPPVPDVPEQTTTIPDDTAAVLGVMLADEATPNWKKKYPQLGAWQASRGMTSDQKFGPGTALRMAQETGLLPIIRFWPRGAIKEKGAVEDYQQALFTAAAGAEEPRKAQLIAAANREQGQGFGRNVQPITPLISI